MGMAIVSPDDVDTTGEGPFAIREWTPTRITFTGPDTPRLLPILVWPDPRLKEVSAPIDPTPPYVKQLVTNMLYTMRSSKGIGLAAPQIGQLVRVIVLEVESGNPCYFINPMIVSKQGTYEWEEGCLSVPGYFERRKRYGQISVEVDLLSGNRETINLNGLYAFALQHEIDHLDGKVFIDDSSQLRKERAREKIRKSLKKRGLA